MPVEIASAYVSIVPTLRPLSGNLSRIFGPVEDAAAQSGEAAGGVFSGGFGKILKAGALVGSVKALGEAAGAAFSGTFGEAMERESSAAKASASLGLSDEESKALGASAGKLYSQAYGESFGEVTDALGVVKSSLKGLGADELEGATKKAMSFSQAFDVDMARSVQTVSTLMGSGLATNADEAFDLITRASQKVPAALREDVLDASDEYSQFFSALGFDANEAFGALTSASDKGVFGIDKTGDAIKEFTIRATDMSASTVGAFSSIGLDAQSMANQILAGGDTAQAATQQIVDGLVNIEDPATQANTAIALFGTPLEDLGVSNIPKFLSSLDSASGGLGDFAGAAADVDSKLGGTIQSKFTAMTRSVGGLGTSIATGLLPVFGPALDGITTFANKAGERITAFSEDLTPKLQAAWQTLSGDFPGYNAGIGEEDSPLVVALMTAGDLWRDAQSKVQAAWQTLAGDFPGSSAGIGEEDSPLVSGLIKANEIFSQVGPVLKEAASILFRGEFIHASKFEEDSPLVDFLYTVRELVEAVLPVAKQMFQDLWSVVGPLFSELGKTLGPAVVEVFNTLWGAVQPLLPMLGQLAPLLNPFHFLLKALEPLIPTVVGVIADLATVLADGIARALQAVQPLFQKLIEVVVRLVPFIQQLVASLLPPLVNLFDQLAPLIDAVLNALLPIVDAIVAALIPAIDALMPIVELVFGFLATTIQNIANALSGLIEFIVGVFTGDWSRAWEGIKAIFGAVWDQMKNVFDTLWTFIGEWFTNLVPATWAIVSGFAGQLISWGGQILGWLFDGIKAALGGVLGWFTALPGMLWNTILTAAQWVVDRGVEFLSWLGQGIEAKAVEISAWFAGLPGMLWNTILVGAQWVVDRGAEFLSWLWNGIAAKAVEVGAWFAALPGVLWNGILAAAGWMVDRGGEFLSWWWDGTKARAIEVVNWYLALPGVLWTAILQAASWMVERGGEFLGWLWDGIKTTGAGVLQWFTDLPGNFWAALLSFAGGAAVWVSARGGEFIGWLRDGIVSGAESLWQWVTDLPKKIWDLITGLASNLVQLGKNIVGWIAEGITSAAKAIWDALTKAVEFEPVSAEAMAAAPQSSTGGYNSNNAPVVTNPFVRATGGMVQARATGGLMEFLDTPGHQFLPNGLIRGAGGSMADAIPTWLSDREFVGRASSVALYQPAYEALNEHRPDLAVASLLDSLPGHALGGVVEPASRKLGQQISEKVAEGIRAGKEMADAASAVKVGSGGGFFDGLFSLGKQVVAQAMAGAGGAFAGNGQWGPATDGSRLADNTLAAKNFITSKWGITEIGGVYGGSVSGSDHPIGKALDVMIANYQSQQGIAQGTSVADWFVGNPNAFGTKYVIWRDRINQGGQWAPYQHPSGSDDNLQHRNHVHLSFLTGAGQFSGQPVSDSKTQIGSLVSKLASTVAGKFGFGSTAGGTSGTPAPVQGGQFVPTVERWRPLATQALAAFGYGPEWVDPMLWQMTTESGGNPNALNDWDRNFPLYGGSKGLLQTIDPTFRSALTGTPYASLIPRGPYDPWANLLAAVSYVKRQYGGPGVWNKSVGGNPNPYDTGGWLPPGGGMGINLLNKPEAVLTPAQSDAYITHAKAIGSDGPSAPTLVINLDSSDPLQVAVAQMIADAWDSYEATVRASGSVRA